MKLGNLIMACYSIIFKKIENHGYMSELGLWFIWELWLWT
jgi:hypothetical protein